MKFSVGERKIGRQTGIGERERERKIGREIEREKTGVVERDRERKIKRKIGV